LGDRLLYGLLGAVLGGLSGIPSILWVDVHLWVIAVCAVLGFIAAWLFGDEAIKFFTSLWWWW
jgi:hypothetical protein